MIQLLLLFTTLTSLAHSNLNVISPPQLKSYFLAQNAGNITYTIANFGVIPYGKKMTGSIVVANPMTNCQYQQDINDENVSNNQKKFILIYRGQCTFVKKVLNAQKQGASLAIIMDNTIQKSQKITMGNDGHGSAVNIPSIFISQEDGNSLFNWYVQNPGKQITMTIKFDTNLADIVNMMIWLDSNNRVSYNFVKKFKSFYDQVKSYLNISAYFNTFQCNSRACNQNDCFFNYKYCAADPDGQYLPGTGKDIIVQQLREYFILKNNPNQWWDYMKAYDQHCVDFSNLNECSNNQMKKFKINYQTINTLVQKSFLQNGDNQILKLTSNLKILSGVSFVPDVLINNMAYLGQLQAIDVFELVCNSLNKPPKQCNSFLFDESKIIVEPKKSHLSTVIIVTITLIIFFIVSVCVYRRIARRQLSRQMNNQVNQLVSQYITLFETRKMQSKQKNVELLNKKEQV